MNASVGRPRSWIGAFVLFGTGAAGLVAPASAAPTLIDFEDQPPLTIITTQYGPKGVVFQDAFLAADLGGRSGTRALRSTNPSSEVFQPVPLVLLFTSPQARVTLFANSPGMARNGTLQAFDANGGLVDQDGPKLVAADAFTTQFEVTSPTPVITKAVLQVENAAHYAIDDLEFDGEPAAPPPPPPQVVITSPPDGALFDTNAFTIEGTITGEGLLPTAKAFVEYGRPPEQAGLPPFTTALSVFGTGTTRQFNLPGGFQGAPLGPIKITVEAENFAALKGTATSTFTNMPLPIRNRAAAEGAGIGDFRFGVFGAGCKVAVYQNAAISAPGFGDETFVIRGNILAKWIPERSHLGCPVAEQRERSTFSFEAGSWCFLITGTEGPCEAPVVPGQVQDFKGGRIYTTEGIGTFYVPKVFGDAIDNRGGESVTGVPIADPSSSVGAMETWLFQRFLVPELPKRLPSTLEIRGSPPRLYIERQAGHLIEPSNRKAIETTGTIWEEFSCDNNLGPCTVEPTPPQPDPIPSTGDFCFGGTIASTLLTGIGPRAWEPVLGREPFFGALPLAALRPTDPGNFISTSIFGVVTFAKLADVDFTLIHEWCYGEDWIPFNCFSDWIFRIRPYGEHKGAGEFGSLYGGTKDNTTVKIEYERYYSDGAIWLGLPYVRDLIFLAGRWVIDCAHDTYKTELHPIFLFSKMKTVTTLTDPFTKLVNPNPFGGTPENPVPGTQADIWVNGWYPGDLVEFDIHPPPRPSADAFLVINKPVDAQAASGVTIEFERQPPAGPSRAHIRFTAPSRHNEVTWLGEMKWQGGRGYEGQWYLYWKE